MTFKVIPLRFSHMVTNQERGFMIVFDNKTLMSIQLPITLSFTKRSLITELLIRDVYKGGITLKEVENELYNIQLDEYLGPLTYTK